ncbi:MAG TPA: DegT/DnrJ/EryC1/StrS family aminotransferase [Caldithrix sp.]|nr:DegT/DnrJ/EryC1/StrS family aminotransferase [Caldithrix sp.]
MEVPFHRSYTTEEDVAGVAETIRSGWLTMGPKTIEFENQFKAQVGAEHAVAVNSGTAALHLGLRVIDLKPGDEVIIPAMTFAATGEVVRYFDAVPVMVDVDRRTHNILPEEIEKHVTAKTRAIIPVHFGGLPADIDEILEIADRHNLKIIEDAAHCFPSFYKGKPVGGFADITAFSFYATKTIAVGEGGMATTDNEEYADLMRILRLHGISKDAWKRYTKEGSWYYEIVLAGFKYNTTDIQASLGLTQLAKAEKVWRMREKIARRYTEAFRNIDQIIMPTVLPDRQTSWHLYVIKLNLEALRIKRDTFIEQLLERGIHTSVHFIPLYRHPYYQKLLSIDYREMPNSEWLFERIISLPIFPGMSKEQIEYVIENVVDIAQKNRR